MQNAVIAQSAQEQSSVPKSHCESLLHMPPPELLLLPLLLVLVLVLVLLLLLVLVLVLVLVLLLLLLPPGKPMHWGLAMQSLQRQPSLKLSHMPSFLQLPCIGSLQKLSVQQSTQMQASRKVHMPSVMH